MPKTVLFDKEEVIKKVTDLFWEKGYNGTSMQDLVDVTGLNRSSIYNTFGDKFQLFNEALKYYRRVQKELLDSLKAKTKSPKEAIALLFNAVWEELNGGSVNGCFISNCTTELSNADPRIFEFLSDNKKSVVETFRILIEDAQELGQIDKEKNAETLAHYLFSSLQGLKVTSMIDRDKRHIKGISDQILASL
jgi:TetR/AcrR family transcriptional regulator, transcriptional repressor for nem operon